ncbi:MAG: prepilin-type N-terminal cleavage/methylation domain-containing protein [Planctomycetota bacterium]
MPVRGRNRASGGFSLLELMFAMTILTVGVMAAFSSQIGSAGLMRTSRETQTAVADLRAAMEDLLTRTPDFLVEHANSPYRPGESVAAYEDLHLSEQRIVASYPEYTAGDDVPDPLAVVLTCTWEDFEGRERSLALRTVLSK